VLTEAQLAALERVREEKKAMGEIETRHPCYLALSIFRMPFIA